MMTLDTTGYIKNKEPLNSLTGRLRVYGWTGTGWREQRLVDSKPSIDVRLGGLIDGTGMVHLRLVAQGDDLSITMPRAEAFDTQS
jgi:hypothetical protein